jgi:hypothetical protein
MYLLKFFGKESFRSKRVSPIIRDYIYELVGTDPIAQRYL